MGGTTSLDKGQQLFEVDAVAAVYIKERPKQVALSLRDAEPQEPQPILKLHLVDLTFKTGYGSDMTAGKSRVGGSTLTIAIGIKCIEDFLEALLVTAILLCRHAKCRAHL